MSPRSPKDTREGDLQDKPLHAVHDASNETQISDKDAATSNEKAAAEKAEQARCVETTVELDRVAVYLKGPTAFSA